jgi:hypothetical protein
MARDATASLVAEAARGVEVLVPSRSVRDYGATLHPFQQRRSHEPDSSDPGGPREDLRAGCQEGICEEVTTGEAERIRSTGAMISSSFVVWQDGPDRREGKGALW